MNNRITSEWTPTLEEAFGESGTKGREGELFVKNAILSWGWEVRDNESNYEEQVAGQDLWIKAPTWKNFYSIDVKANMGEHGVFPIVIEQWMNPKKLNDRFWHVNVDTGWMAWYSREEMQYYIMANNIKENFRVYPGEIFPFKITRTLHKGNHVKQ